MFRHLFRSSTLTHYFDLVRHSIRFPVGSVKMSSANGNFVRLPTIVQPVNYKLDFVPNFSNFTFSGVEQVELKVSLINSFLYFIILYFII